MFIDVTDAKGVKVWLNVDHIESIRPKLKDESWDNPMGSVIWTNRDGGRVYAVNENTGYLMKRIHKGGR